jgi:hypothetical protein
MSFRFIEDYRDTYLVRLMCAVLEVSPAGYYAWRERPISTMALHGPCHSADAGTWRQLRPDRTADASIGHSGDHGAAPPGSYHR